MTPKQVCRAFAKGLGRPVKYRRGPIEFHVSIPTGYREHLEALQEVLGAKRAPYFGPTMYYPEESLELWEGNRGLEEYAREVFPMEEHANGCSWMHPDEEEDADDEEDDDGADDDMESTGNAGTPGGGASNGYGGAGTPGDIVTM